MRRVYHLKNEVQKGQVMGLRQQNVRTIVTDKGCGVELFIPSIRTLQNEHDVITMTERSRKPAPMSCLGYIQ